MAVRNRVMARIWVLGLAAYMLAAAGCSSQNAGTGVATTPPPAPEVRPRIAGNAAKMVANALANLAVGTEISRALEALAPEMDRRLPWLGDQGILLDVRVARGNTDPSDPVPLRLVTIVDRGVGSTPRATLTAHLKQATILPQVPTGYRGSPENSYLIWIKADGKPELIPYPLSQTLQQQSFADGANAVLMTSLKQNAEYDRLRALDQSLATAIPNTEGRASAQRLSAGALEARNRLAAINAELQAELERQRRAAAALQWLDTLGKGLSIVTQLAEMKSMLGDDAPPSPLNISNEVVLKEYVTTLHVKVMQNRTTLEQRRTVIGRDSEEAITEFRDHLETLDVPKAVMP